MFEVSSIFFLLGENNSQLLHLIAPNILCQLFIHGLKKITEVKSSTT